MSDVVEEAAPAAPTTGDHPSSCCCSGGSANKRRSTPDDDDDQLVKKSKKQLFPRHDFNSPASTSRPPRPPSALRRTTSDPLPYSQLFKKLRDGIKKLRDGMKKLNICLEEPPLSEIVSQDEQSHQKISQVSPHGEDSEADDSDSESVSVEKTGDSFNIRFRCPCGKSYHFMVYQGSCFYKLM